MTTAPATAAFTFFLFTGEASKAVFKSYAAEPETEMACKIIMAVPATGAIVRIDRVEPAIAMLLSMKYPTVDGINGLTH